MSVRTRLAPVLLLGVLACVGCVHEKTTAELVADLKSHEEKDRIVAARLLPQHKGDAAQTVPALVGALKDSDGDVRRSAAIGLGSFGAEAREAIPALKAVLHDRDARVREAAGVAMSRIDPTITPPPPAPKRPRDK